MTVLKVTALVLGPVLLAWSVWLNRREGSAEAAPREPFPVRRLLMTLLVYFGGAFLVAGILLVVFGP